jgi:hypothetical protein
MGGTSQDPRKRKDNRIGFSFPEGTGQWAFSTRQYASIWN